MQSNDMALPPDYSVMRGCGTDLCNAQLMTHDAIPNLSAGVPGGGAGAGKPGEGPEGRGLRWTPPGCRAAGAQVRGTTCTAQPEVRHLSVSPCSLASA